VKLEIDTDARTLTVVGEQGRRSALPLYSAEACGLLTEAWLKVEWSRSHWQSFSWMGLQVLQLSQDLVRLQEALVEVAPDVIIETGVYGGGSALFFSSICRLLGKGRVIAIDIHVRPEVRVAFQANPLLSDAVLLEGSSTAPEVVARVKGLIDPADRVLVFLDSDHSKRHVREELELYGPLVSPGSYLIVADGVMEILADTPSGQASWADDNPAAATRDFLRAHAEFAYAPHRPPFSPDHAIPELTYFRNGWLKRVA
jgi:cephalosporin hydroxylase